MPQEEPAGSLVLGDAGTEEILAILDETESDMDMATGRFENRMAIRLHSML